MKKKYTLVRALVALGCLAAVSISGLLFSCRQSDDDESAPVIEQVDEAVAETQAENGGQAAADEQAESEEQTGVESQDAEGEQETAEASDAAEEQTAAEAQSVSEEQAAAETQDGAEEQVEAEAQGVTEEQAAAETQDVAEEQAVTEVQDAVEEQAAAEVQDAVEAQAVAESQDTTEEQTTAGTQNAVEEQSEAEAQGATEAQAENAEAVLPAAAVGDIMLRDGTRVPKIAAADYAFSSDNAPVAVVAYCTADGYVAAALPCSEAVAWACSDAACAKKKLAALLCVPSATGTGVADKELTFEGSIDGSGNWAEICSEDESAIANAEQLYPAFSYAQDVGTSHGLASAIADDWYIPSIAELYYIYMNSETITESFAICGCADIDACSFWSSSAPTTTRNETAYYLNWKTATIASKNRTTAFFVMPIRQFVE